MEEKLIMRCDLEVGMFALHVRWDGCVLEPSLSCWWLAFVVAIASKAMNDI